ncbi:hypothetical protein GF376_00030 [Candidatus Peregrinibacteria bacterium]|nr:hypothetical protein [Candidatus Peregrinibacteria bacterium]
MKHFLFSTLITLAILFAGCNQVDTSKHENAEKSNGSTELTGSVTIVEKDEDVVASVSVTPSDELIDQCEAEGGTWLEEFNECESVSESWCSQNSGNFNDCASACRHDESAEICIEVCVPVCSF